MSVDTWVSVLLAIPLAIVANLLTPRLQKWLEARSVRNALERKDLLLRLKRAIMGRLEAELRLAQIFAQDIHALQLRLTVAVLKAILVGAVTASVTGVMLAYGALPDLVGSSYFAWLSRATALAGQLAALFGSLLVVQISRDAYRDYIRARDFENFRAATEAQIARLRLEIEAQNGA